MGRSEKQGYEKKYGKRRQNHQSHCRYYRCSTLFFKCDHRNTWNHTLGACRSFCFDKFFKCMPAIYAIWPEYLRDKGY